MYDNGVFSGFKVEIEKCSSVPFERDLLSLFEKESIISPGLARYIDGVLNKPQCNAV